MRKLKYVLGGLTMFTLIGMILTHVVSSQKNSDIFESQSDLILFTRRYDYDASRFRIFVLNLHTREEVELATNDFCCATSWSPDGSRILVHLSSLDPWASASLILMDADGQNRQVLTDPAEIDPNEGVWSPDGSQIYFWGRNRRLEAGEPRWAIYVVSANGGPIRRLTELTSLAGALTISPDGSQLIFTQNETLYRIAAEGGEAQLLGLGLRVGALVVWSPDGSRLAAFVFASDRIFELYIITPDGSSSHLLAADMGSFSNVQWSSDGSELLFLAHRGGGLASTLGIWSVATNMLSTHEVGQGVLESLDAITAATWSPDSSRIVISGRYRANNPNSDLASLYLVDRNVTEIHRLTREHVDDEVVQWRPQSE